MASISTGYRALDDMMMGGFPIGDVNLVYGEAETGKTTLALQCSVACMRDGFKVIFVDSDHRFSTSRLSQIMDHNVELLSPLMIVFTPEEFEEQGKLIENFERYITKSTRLIVFDTITGLYREARGSPRETFALSRELNRQLAYLREVAETRQVAVLLISQVHAVLDSGKAGESQVEPLAIRILNHWCNNILSLRSTGKPNVKEAGLEKLNGREIKGSKCFFRLGSRGLEDVREVI